MGTMDVGETLVELIGRMHERGRPQATPGVHGGNKALCTDVLFASLPRVSRSGREEGTSPHTPIEVPRPSFLCAQRPARVWTIDAAACNVVAGRARRPTSARTKTRAKRQRDAIQAFARKAGCTIVDEFYDAAVKGAGRALRRWTL